MELKRSKIYKMKNQDMRDDTGKEREFRNAVIRQARCGKDEKIILSFALVILFILSFFVESEANRVMVGILMFFTGLVGIIL